MTRKLVAVSALVAAPVVLSLVGLRFFSPHVTTDSSGSRRLSVPDPDEVRPLEGRWLGLGNTPFPADRWEEIARSSEFKSSVKEILRQGRSTPESIAYLALVYLATGKGDQASRLLEEGVGAFPRDCSLRNNLALAYLAKARLEKDHYYLFLALSAIQQARALYGKQPEVAFNYALILEHLHIRRQSLRAWERYLDLEPDSEWTAAAQKHRSALAASGGDAIGEVNAAIRSGQLQRAKDLVAQSPQQLRVYLEDTLLPDWALALERGDLRLAQQLGRLTTTIATFHFDISGDHLLVDAARILEASRPTSLGGLTAAHRHYRHGSQLYGQGRFTEAEAAFHSAGRLFDRVGDPLAMWSQFYASACKYQQGHVNSATDSALKLRERASSAGYHNLTGRIDWMVGLVRLERADPAEALVHLRRALSTFGKTGERSSQGAVASLVANALTYLGAADEAWNSHLLASEALSEAGDEAWLSGAYGGLARSLLKRGNPELALTFQDEALLLDSIYKDPIRSSEAFWWRAMIHRDLGDPRAALKDLELARTRCAAIPEPATRERNLAGILVTEGSIRVSLDPRSAVTLLTHALDLYATSEYSYLLSDIYLERGRAFRQLDLPAAAEADFRAAIAEFEAHRAEIPNFRQRISYFGRAADVFDEMVDFQVADRSDMRKAFDYSERSRAREALDTAECSGTCREQPRELREITAALPAQTALLHYHALEDRLLVWTLTREGSFLTQVRVSRSSLEALIASVLTAIADRQGSSSFGDASMKLYQLLIKPMGRGLLNNKRLVIVPDGTLGRLPFSGLLDPQTDKFLIESIPVVVAPSSTLYMSAAEAGRARQSPSLTSLAIGNPEIDRSRYPDLADLPAAENEARSLAMRAPGSVLLTRKEATISRLLQEANRHDVVHLGVHALVDEAVPGRSRLLLAVQKGTGELSAEEIGRLRLSRPRLVVLSACNTGGGPSQGLEGVSDLARPFLVAGSPAVLVSLWSVGDREAEVFWDFFYDELFTGQEPVVALQNAQLAMLRHARISLAEPRVWAGYRLIGAF